MQYVYYHRSVDIYVLVALCEAVNIVYLLVVRLLYAPFSLAYMLRLGVDVRPP